MKSHKSITVITPIAVRAVFFMALMAVWYVRFPNFLRSVEERAFWTDAPDMTHTMYHWPADAVEITCQYFAQYFDSRLLGAALMALWPLLIVLAIDTIFFCVRKHWQKARHTTVQKSYHAILALVMLLAGVLVATSTTLLQHEQNARIEHMAADRQWDRLLAETYPLRHELDDSQMAYSLLALSMQGKFAEQLFHYPIKGLDNIFAHSSNFRFNSFFCHELHLPNEAIRYAFEEGQYMPAGASFGTMRRMVDWLLEKGDDPELAEFYLNLLSHSSRHKSFVATRRILLHQTQLGRPKSEPEFVGSPSFLYEAALVLEREPDNLRARDYLLCGLLVLGNTDAFYDIFQRTFVETNEAAIPTHYLEALLVLKDSHPEIGSSYDIPIKLEGDYRTFVNLVAQGANGKQQAIRQYPNTYWAYLLRKSQEGKKPQAEPIVIDAPGIIGPEFGN